MDQMKSVRSKASEIADDLKAKIIGHTQIIGELEKFNKTISRYARTGKKIIAKPFQIIFSLKQK